MAFAAPIAMGVMAVAGAAFTNMGAKAQADAAAKQAKAVQRAAEYDAALHMAESEAELAKARLDARRQTAATRSAGARTGTVVGEGSLLELELEAARLGEYGAQLAAYPGRLSSSQSRFKAQLAKVEASNIKKTGRYVAFTSAMGSLMSSGSSIASGMIR